MKNILKLPNIGIIQVKGNPIALGLSYTCCSKCELIITHQHEFEKELHNISIKINPEVIGTEFN